MDLIAFRASLKHEAPVSGLSPLLRALWLDAKGDWQGAHEIAQSKSDTLASWVHAYLHRKEGDLNNAQYWYKRAGQPVCNTTLAKEWLDIARTLLD